MKKAFFGIIPLIMLAAVFTLAGCGDLPESEKGYTFIIAVANDTNQGSRRLSTKLSLSTVAAKAVLW